MQQQRITMGTMVTIADRRPRAPRRIACCWRGCADWVSAIERLKTGMVMPTPEKVSLHSATPTLILQLRRERERATGGPFLVPISRNM